MLLMKDTNVELERQTNTALFFLLPIACKY